MSREDRRPAPPLTGHAVTCRHRWCYCYDPASHEKDPDCIHCRREKRHRDRTTATT